MSEKRISLASILIASIGVVALIGGIVFFVVGRLGGQGGGEPAESAAAESQPEGVAPDAPSVDPDDPEASRCGLTVYSDTNDLETTAPETKWEWVDSVFMVAKSEDHGPGVVEDNGIRYCYARTPTGVLYAAYNLGAMGRTRPASEFAEYTTVAGTVRDELIQDTDGPQDYGYKLEPAGFRISGYSADSAIVEVVYAFGGSGLIASKVQMRWEEGDWRVVPLEDGSIFLSTQSISSLAGYVPWSVDGV